MTDDRQLSEFATQLMMLVRDRSIASVDRATEGTLGPKGERWNRALRDDQVRQAVRELAPDIVDEVLFQLLEAVDEGELQISFTDSSGTTTPLETLGNGELAGWLMMSGGWRQLLSAERSHDDFSDLKLQRDRVVRKLD